jgi:hypothetical protein
MGLATAALAVSEDSRALVAAPPLSLDEPQVVSLEMPEEARRKERGLGLEPRSPPTLPWAARP